MRRSRTITLRQAYAFRVWGRSVDALLANETPCTQLRRFVGDRALVRFEGPSADPGFAGGRAASAPGGREQVGGAAPGQWLDDLVNLSKVLNVRTAADAAPDS